MFESPKQILFSSLNVDALAIQSTLSCCLRLSERYLENEGEESYGNVKKGGEARLNPPLGEIIYMLNKRNIEFVLCVLTSYQYVQYSLCQYICSLLLQSLRSSPKTRHL